MTVLKIFKIGSIPEEFMREVETILRTFYSSVNTDLEYVEVYVYETSEKKRYYLHSEATELGVLALGDFIVSHDAWRGWPRIHVDYELCKDLSKEYLETLLIHEAVHSVLHGSIDFYIASISGELLEEFDPYVASEIIYLASVIVKDLDVFRFLIRNNMSRYVEKYLELSVNKWLPDSNCGDIIETLSILKLLLPCVYLRCDLSKMNLPRDCIKIISRELSRLADLYNVCDNDFDCKLNHFIKFIKHMVS
ncbi:MAG: hypothetical protein ACP5GI_07890 [Sulfolobales archaeon]